MPHVPDWPRIADLSPSNREIVEATRECVGRLLQESANAGMAMRGITMAIADHYETRYLDRGEQSVLRGTRNAFAEIAIERG